MRDGATWRDIGLLSGLLAVLFALLAGHPAFGSAIRYAEAAREMVELGDWVVPHLAYVPYFEKPILTYWLGAAAVALFGTSWHAVHLPAGVAALGSLLATYALGRTWHGRGFGLGAALLLLGTGYFLVFATELTTDPILSACVAFTLLAGWRMQHDTRSYGPWWWAFWIGLGAATLSKGMVGLAIPACGIAAHAWLTGGVPGVFLRLWRMHPFAGGAVLLGMHLPWVLAVWQRDPRFVEFFYIRYNLLSFVDSGKNHRGPWWYYLPVLPILVAPVILPGLFALAAQIARVGAGLSGWRCWRGWGPASAEDDLRRYLVCWLVLPLVMFSVSSSKLISYVLPLVPVATLLAADWYRRCGDRAVARWLGLVQAAVVVVGGAVGLLLLHLDQLPLDGDRLAPAGVPWLVAALVLLIVSHTYAAWSWLYRQPLRALAAICLGVVLVQVCVLPRALDLLEHTNTDQLVAALRRMRSPTDSVIVHVSAVHDYRFTFGLGQRLSIYGPARELGMGHLSEITRPDQPFPADTYRVDGDRFPEHPWLYSGARLRERWNSPERVWLVCRNDDLAPHLRQVTGAEPVLVMTVDEARLYTNLPLP